MRSPLTSQKKLHRIHTTTYAACFPASQHCEDNKRHFGLPVRVALTLTHSARSTPFAVATVQKQFDAMRLLARRGADVHPVAAGGITPLSISCSSASVTPVRILLTELGMNPMTPMNQGCLLQVILDLCQTSPVLENFLQLQATPEALRRRRLDIAELLISAGIDLEVRHLGDSAVHMAAESGSRRLMVALLRAGASTSSVGKASDGVFGTTLSRAAVSLYYSEFFALGDVLAA